MFDNFYEIAGNEFFRLYNFAWVALALVAYIISKRYFPNYKYAFMGFFFGAVSLPLSGAVLMIVDNKIAELKRDFVWLFDPLFQEIDDNFPLHFNAGSPMNFE